ncbi:uncharacterized protein VTP21DRAFT_3136 [Calcarisporiella thermophila]|uniref:uncharacterized protein n=1 Tax=Calcarisporiella thermophila TaxID=911321 RepID=UPI003742B24D
MEADDSIPWLFRGALDRVGAPYRCIFSYNDLFRNQSYPHGPHISAEIMSSSEAKLTQAFYLPRVATALSSVTSNLEDQIPS